LIVVDASAVVVALVDDGTDGRRARERLSGERLVAPEVIDLEVLSAWRRLCATGRLHRDRVELAIADLEVLRIERVPHRRLLRRCWELRDNLTVYDAAYVALAENLGALLLTADQRLAKAPVVRCEFELLPDGHQRQAGAAQVPL
jgi:predicted nucleic acid-binding protein